MYMVSNDSSHLKGNFYQYKLEHKVYSKPKQIEIKRNEKLNTPEKLLSTLFYAYINQDKKLFLSLFDDKGVLAVHSLSKEKYKKQMDVMKLITKPFINYAFKYKKGIVISWKDPLFRQSRQIFIKKIKGQYKISTFKSDKNDHYFWNVNLYMAGAPFEIYTPKLLTSFKKIKNGQKKILSFKLIKQGHYIQFIKKNNTKISLSIKDNHFKENAPLNDENNKLQYVDVKLKGEHFKNSGENILYYLESSYPMTSITNDDMKKMKKLVIIKK